jgi:hypothetical protein
VSRTVIDAPAASATTAQGATVRVAPLLTESPVDGTRCVVPSPAHVSLVLTSAL